MARDAGRRIEDRASGGGAVLARIAPIPLLLALAGSLAYWPGLVTWDSLRQYDQALSGAFDDWHPPLMGWIWRQMLPLAHSPAPMLLVQLGLYAAGFLLLLRPMIRMRRGGWAFATALCAVQPIVIALMATIVKDSLMTGALLCAAGLIVQAERREKEGRRAGAARAGAVALCILASALRFNGFLAILPLALWALPPAWRDRPLRCLVSSSVLLPMLLAAMPLANRMIGAESSDVTLSLIIFDLGGITEFSGENQFPPLGVRDPASVNHRCYTPVKWDSYSWWVDEICPINFTAIQTYVHRHDAHPATWWLRAVVHHPLAYVLHRARHWNINARFLVKDEVERPVQVAAPPNEWRFDITRNPVVRLVDAGARASAHTPLGWPCVWMAALAALLWHRRGDWRFDMVTVLAASALLYGLGYGALSVASELRYYLWTYCAGSIALVAAVAEGTGRRRLPVALLLPVGVALAALLSRL